MGEAGGWGAVAEEGAWGAGEGLEEEGAEEVEGDLGAGEEVGEDCMQRERRGGGVAKAAI